MDTLGRVLARMADAGIALTDAALRRPSLDDVFLALTGHPAAGATPDDPATPGDPGGPAASGDPAIPGDGGR
nr:hypothetical protein [Candidatus Frankia nodulisporulans]